ncbi:MAG: class I SAM-dependent methyltransferase [Myxococcales bacterium]|nr:class I SAM-dependent methyltransferase [Myxococcales bacterium]
MSFILPARISVCRSEVPPQWGCWRLGPRLASLASGVPKGARMADIGTDHALLPEVLARAGWVERALGIDRAEDALRAARERLDGVPWPGVRVELWLGDGLGLLRAEMVDCAVMAGFGGRKMVELLERHPPEQLGITRLVLQPTAGLPALRRYLSRRGWQIVSEQIVCEGRRGFITSIMIWDGRLRELTSLEALIGRVSVDEPLLFAWMHVQLQHLLRQGDRARALRAEVEKWLAHHPLTV